MKYDKKKKTKDSQEPSYILISSTICLWLYKMFQIYIKYGKNLVHDIILKYGTKIIGTYQLNEQVNKVRVILDKLLSYVSLKFKLQFVKTLRYTKHIELKSTYLL